MLLSGSRMTEVDRASEFRGFPPETFEFLKAIARHDSDREWFDAHREQYERWYVAPALAFITSIGPRVRKLSPGVHVEPKVGGSLFRIHRDRRFARSPRRYKHYVDVWFWRGEHKGRDAPSFFVRLHADRFELGAGIRVLAGDQLAAYRAAVDDPRRGRALAKIVAELERAGPYALGGEERQRMPTGFADEHPRADLLRRAGLYASLEGPLPKVVGTARFTDECVKHFGAMLPLCRWLATAVTM